MQTFSQFFSIKDLIPHGYCLSWSPTLLSLSVLSDGLITISYYFIPISMIFYLRKVQIENKFYQQLIWLFSAFIIACGTTHLLSIITIWIPLYWLDITFKLITAMLSIATAVIMFLHLPKAIQAVIELNFLANKNRLAIENERNKMELDLLANQELLRNIIDRIPASVFAFDLQNRFILLNQTLAKTFGLSKEEVIDKSLYDVFLKDTADNLLITNNNILATGNAFDGEEVVTSSFNNEPRTMLTSRFPLRDTNGSIIGLGGVAKDITERKIVEDQLRLSDTALNNINQGIMITDSESNIIWTNKALQQLFGYNDLELIGQSPRCFQGSLSDRKTVNSISLALKEHRPFYGEILNYRKDGSSFWIELNILPILNDKGHLNHFMSISRDMTEQKLAEATLQQGKSEAEKANKIKSQFLAMMSHEIRTPLNAMLGIQELLINTSLNALQREYMLIAKNSGGHLQRLVNDILDLTKVEAGKLDLEYISFNVVELTQLCVQLLTIQAQAKGLKLITIIDPKLTPWISGDPLRFRQVVLNLLSNAIKFTEQGSVTVKLSSYASTDSSCVLLVEVVDTGIGIPEDLQAGLFEVFVQVDPSDTRKYGGSGLGLAISKRLVTLWDGQIGIDSTPYVGSRFWFTVGASVVAPEQPLLPTIKQDESNRPNTFIVRVLLVEDNLINQAVMAAMLRSAGHHVDLADCGAKGIEAASEKDYDIILMDVSMPDMSGMEATAIIRQLGGAAAKVPIIAITAHALAGYEAMCLAAGMNGYATKPISQKNLQTIVATWCFKSKTQVLEALSTLTEDEDSRALKTDEPAILIDEAILADLNRFLGQEKFNEILQIFLISVNRSCEAIKQAIDSQDLSVFIREAHDLKSTSATFGATSLQVIAKDLEVYSDTDDISGALLAAELLLSCAKRTIEALECFN